MMRYPTVDSLTLLSKVQVRLYRNEIQLQNAIFTYPDQFIKCEVHSSATVNMMRMLQTAKEHH